MRRSRHLNPVAVVVLAVLTVVAITWWATSSQRTMADHAFGDLQRSQLMLAGIAEQEVNLLTFTQVPDPRLIDDSRAARRTYEQALAEQLRQSAKVDDASQLALVREQARLAQRWQRFHDFTLARLRTRAAGAEDPTLDARLTALREFRAANEAFQADIVEQQDEAQQRSALISLGVVVLMGVLFGGGGLALIGRSRTRARKRRAAAEERARAQALFREVLQLAPNEDEAHSVIGAHLAHELPEEADVSLLRRNNSHDRLEVVAYSGTEKLPLPQGSEHPIECLAMKLNRRHDGVDGPDYLRCDLCGMAPGATACSPVLVAGEVIGSVVVNTPGPLDELQHARVAETIDQAAPVLANLRNLAVAETRAATDALTGLPNRRAITENMHRMLAHAGRTLTPLAAVMLDLDHFKQINDIHGHDRGDAVLAAVADVLRSGLRTSDLAGRSGGEEFVVLLNDTGLAGAELVAEKLRVAISELDLPRLDRKVSASFGIAVFPDHATDAETLLRSADRALYAAKRGGRNRVETVESVTAT